MGEGGCSPDDPSCDPCVLDPFLCLPPPPIGGGGGGPTGGGGENARQFPWPSLGDPCGAGALSALDGVGASAPDSSSCGGPLEFGFVDCAYWIKELEAAKLKVAQRTTEMILHAGAGQPDKMKHAQALREAVNRLNNAYAKVIEHCSGPVLVAILLAEVAVTLAEAEVVLAAAAA